VPGRRSWRRAALGGVAAAAACGAILASSVVGPHAAMPQAHALDRLALVAESAPQAVPGPGQYVHQVTRFVQQGSGAQTPAIDTTSESWVRADGTTWRREVARRQPVGTTYLLQRPAPLGDDPFFGIRPADYLRWPTGTLELRRYVQARVARPVPGASVDVTQAVFEDLSDRFATGVTPAALNAAMIRVLGSLPGVTTSRVTYDGHGAVRVAYRYGVVDALYFDERTAQFLGETMPGLASHVLTRDVVGSVPEQVRRRAHEG
jgi:hypothetical protein